MFALLLGLACVGDDEPPGDSAPTTADSEGDTEPPVEDCGDGVDNDGDGLVDCEDEECVGADECALRDFELDVEYSFDTMEFEEDPFLGAYLELSYDMIAKVYGLVHVTGVAPDPDTSDSVDQRLEFSCSGQITVFTQNWVEHLERPEAAGLSLDTGACEGCDFRFAFLPANPTWSGDCPVSTLPLTHWGVFVGRPYVMSDLGGSTWVKQYVSEPQDVYWVDYYGYGLYGYLSSPTTAYAVSTTRSYDPDDL